MRGLSIGAMPTNQARYLLVDEPNNGVYYGGDVAAPVFSQVVQQTLRMLGVAPDLDVKPQIVMTAVPESF